MSKSKLNLTKNENFIPFDFSNLITNDKLKEIYKLHGYELAETEISEMKKFMQLWLEVLYIQFKRQQIQNNEQQEESHIIYSSEYRRAS